jgi:hypothetical protein
MPKNVIEVMPFIVPEKPFPLSSRNRFTCEVKLASAEFNVIIILSTNALTAQFLTVKRRDVEPGVGTYTTCLVNFAFKLET